MGQISVFFRNYARRIDRLPILNVDLELVDFGRWVSISPSLGPDRGYRSGRSQSDRADGSRAGHGDGHGHGRRHGGWGWTEGMGMGIPMGRGMGGVGVGVPVAGFQRLGRFLPARRRPRRPAGAARVRTQERVRGTMSATVILQAIDEAAADIRVAMTQKYKVEF